MSKLLAILALLVCQTALADPLLLTPENNRVDVPKLLQKCQPNCLVMDQKDWAAFMDQVNAAIRNAFEAGKQAERSRT